MVDAKLALLLRIWQYEVCLYASEPTIQPQFACELWRFVARVN